jgi:hypothetical protein
MTPAQVLSSLEARGVRLVPDPAAPSGFRAVAPRGVVTPRVAAKIRAALPMLLPLIEDRAPVPNPASEPGKAGTSESFGASGRSMGRTEAQAGISESRAEISPAPVELTEVGRESD